MSDGVTIITNLGAFAIGSGLLTYLVKTLVTQALSRDLESFKSNLRKDHEIELERLRADIRIVAFERETRFAKLHEKRGEVIDEIYRRLHKLDVAISKLIFEAGPRPNEEKEQTVVLTGNEFSSFLFENRIYFEEHLCDKLEDFNRKVTIVFTDHLLQHIPGLEGKARAERFGKAVQGVTEMIPPLRKDIETSFRTLLGIPTVPKKTD